jgi:apolipoprotein N-acyltransferase
VSDFVRKGAQFLVVVTNDSWWGKSAGPYQHAQYAVLRAIENRRSIARCANGGISCFVDPYGRIESATELYTRATLKGEVELSNDLTFYARYGDMFSVVCSYLSFTILGAGIFSLIMKRFRR